MAGLNSVSIIIPVYNEKNTIEKVIRKMISLEPAEIVVVNDGSSDGTKEILEKLKIENGKIKVIHHEKNQGKGAAIRTAIECINDGIIVIQDADLEYNPDEIQNLIKPIEENYTSVVYGSRFLKKPIINIYKRYKIGNWLLSKIISILYGQMITDSYTCYKIFKAETIKSIDLKSKGFEFEAEVTVKFLKKGIKILELPISYSPRRLEEGKKIGWKDGIAGLWTIWRYL
ncbi:MAG: glycosyltransferase family 2 protein [Elusimicrobia bacterium]|nr:glycosyltransferase family 2 protein [Elusimicrobiota bacterium]